MGTEKPGVDQSLSPTRSIFTDQEQRGEPLTTREVADALGCARRTAYDKLETLAEQGDLKTKKVGARGRIWWLPTGIQETDTETTQTLEETQFQELVKTVTDYAIFLLDPDGYIKTWNDGAQKVKGYEANEIIGEHVSTFYTEADREAGRPEQNLATAIEEKRVEDEGWRVQKNGSRFWANVTITALHDDTGTLRGFAKVTRDMTERHEYEEQLRTQRDELDELNQINSVIRDIDQALVAATSRPAIEEEVCTRLAMSEIYEAAWIAEYTEEAADFTPRTWTGISDEYMEAIRNLDADTEMMEKAAGVTALQTQTIQPIQHLAYSQLDDSAEDEFTNADPKAAIAVPLIYNDVAYGILTVYADTQSVFDERKIAVMRELGENISHAIAAIQRKEREQVLTALQGSTRELLHAETPNEIGSTIVDTLTDDLALADAIVYYFNTVENTLEPVGTSLRNEMPSKHPPTLTAGDDTPIWTSFMDGETQIIEAVGPAPEMQRRRTMFVPLEKHGIITVSTNEDAAFDENSRSLVELVGATAAAAFSRVESQANLRERDDLLQARNQRLQRVNQINTIIREVDKGLVQATTREDVQRIVCEQLTKSDRFRFAWIGLPSEETDGLTPDAWSGNGRGYLDNIDLTHQPSIDKSEPALTASKTGDVTVVTNVAEELRRGRWQKEAFKREFQSILSVPLSYSEVTYGVLSVYADQPAVFDDMEQSVFAELGKTIANAIDAVDTKQALLSDRVVEVELHLEPHTTSVIANMARQLDCEVRIEGIVPVDESQSRVFLLVTDAASDAIEQVLERAVAVESHQLIATRNEGHLIEMMIGGASIPQVLLTLGVSLRSLTATPDRTELAVGLPSNLDVRRFMDEFKADFETVEFIARRERERPIQSRSELYADLESRLTKRQLEVLETAYYSGFFRSPRESTGGDIAELLGVSQPTITEQLRTAQSKLLDLLLTENTADQTL